MRKLGLIFCYLFLCACSSEHDETYYREHPETLKDAVAQCSLIPFDQKCVKLDVIAMEMNKYIYELQTSPQIFGQSILKLQETIAKQKLKLKYDSNNEKLKNKLHKNLQSLSERLAIVRWLESPSR